MRFIPTRIHGFLDYGMGLLLIVAPWILGFADGGPETWVPVILGIGVIGYSLFTDYELGAVHAIPMATHLMLDIGGGIVLAVSPWVFGFADDVRVPHAILGILEIEVALMTRTIPETTRTYSRSAIWWWRDRAAFIRSPRNEGQGHHGSESQKRGGGHYRSFQWHRSGNCPGIRRQRHHRRGCRTAGTGAA